MSDTPPLRTPEWSGVVIKKWVGSEQTDALAASSLSFFLSVN